MKRYKHNTNAHATAEDFCEVFHNDMAALYQLALLLTADHKKAESIFVGGIDECINGNPVFKVWARQWARRVIITSAIRVVAPLPGALCPDFVENDPAAIRRGHDAAVQHTAVQHTAVQHTEVQRAPQLTVTGLAPFNRFVFVMTVLERLCDKDCATLLGCSRAAIVAARVQALQQIARGQAGKHDAERCPPPPALAARAGGATMMLLASNSLVPS